MILDDPSKEGHAEIATCVKDFTLWSWNAARAIILKEGLKWFKT